MPDAVAAFDLDHGALQTAVLALTPSLVLDAAGACAVVAQSMERAQARSILACTRIPESGPSPGS
jgi:hypothetical protein